MMKSLRKYQTRSARPDSSNRTDDLLNYNDIDKLLKKGKTKAVVVFEKNFGHDLLSEGKGDI